MFRALLGLAAKRRKKDVECGGECILGSSAIRALLGFVNSPPKGRSRNTSRNGPVEAEVAPPRDDGASHPPGARRTDVNAFNAFNALNVLNVSDGGREPGRFRRRGRGC